MKRFTSIDQSTVCPGICNLLYLVIYSFHLFPTRPLCFPGRPGDRQLHLSGCDSLNHETSTKELALRFPAFKALSRVISWKHWETDIVKTCKGIHPLFFIDEALLIIKHHQTWSEYPLLLSIIIIHHGLWPRSTWYPLCQICQILCLLPVQNGNPSHRFTSEARYWGSSLGDDHPWKRLKTIIS